ncbi:MAG TPA: hypothetical protein VF037_05295, partial [Gemmatimonadales bacterium]
MRAVVRSLVLLVAVALLAAALPLVPDLLPADDADRAAWRDELGQVERHLASAYANFQWAVESDSVDLPSIHHRADSALAVASNRRAARRAFRDLAAAFGDGHLRVAPPDHPALRLAERAWRGGGGAVPAGTGAAKACRRMGFDDESHPFGIPFDEMAGYEAVAVYPFRAGTVADASGEAVGVLRIASFSEWNYARSCEEAWTRRAAVAADACAEDCQDEIYGEVSRTLVASLARTLEELERRGVRTLVVDVTGNGGGSGIADALARELTAVPLRASPVGLIRHPHPLESLRESDSLFARELASADLGAAHRRALEDGRARVSHTMDQIGT